MLHDYKNTNVIIGSAALKSFSGHLWYLSEFLIGLAFFDSSVSIETKRDMVKNLDRVGQPNPPRRVKFNPGIILQQLPDFVTTNAVKFFDAVGIQRGFLSEDPAKWEALEDYQAAKTIIGSIKVVNDAAERGIALMTDFNDVLCRSEEQKQYLLQVVENHRRNIPNSKKATILNSFNSC